MDPALFYSFDIYQSEITGIYYNVLIRLKKNILSNIFHP